MKGENNTMAARPIDGNAVSQKIREIAAINSEYFSDLIDAAPMIKADLLECAGYKMFRGKMQISTERNALLTRTIEATWLYMPDEDQWICGNDGRVFTADRCAIAEGADAE